MSESPDPTAGERACRYPCGCDQFPEEHCACMDGHAPAEPDAGDVEALAKAICEGTHAHIRRNWTASELHPDHCPSCALSARAVLASDWLDAVRRKAGDERAEQIAQAIEAAPGLRLGHNLLGCSCLRCDVAHAAARIARESRT